MVVAAKQKPKNTSSHRKRHGAHQRRGQHFAKTYWPYLPMLVIVGVGLFLNSIWAQASGVLSYATNMTAGGLLTSTNTERTQNGLGGLTLNGALSQAAQAKADDMVARNYWSHNTPDGKEPWVFINATGYVYQAAGENLAYGFGTSGEAVTGWMNSPGHRANILNGNFQEVGFGIANGANFQGGEETVVVALYAKPTTTVAKNPSQAPATAKPQATTPPATSPTITAGEPIAAEVQEDTQSMKVSAVVPGPTKVARVQMATSGGAPWSLVALSLVMLTLLVLFVLRHSIAWHKMWVRGERFVLKHKFLDFVIVSGIMIGYLLTRTAGVIH